MSKYVKKDCEINFSVTLILANNLSLCVLLSIVALRGKLLKIHTKKFRSASLLLFSVLNTNVTNCSCTIENRWSSTTSYLSLSPSSLYMFWFLFLLFYQGEIIASHRANPDYIPMRLAGFMAVLTFLLSQQFLIYNTIMKTKSLHGFCCLQIGKASKYYGLYNPL